MHTIWVFVTDCGDSAVTVPLALLVLAFLMAAGQRQVALAWLLVIAGAAAAIAALKLGFGACGQRLPLGHIVSPSGHAAMSTAVYGSLAMLVGARLSPLPRRAVFIAATAAIIGIALSRLALHDHSIAEIVVGLGVGAAAIVLFRALLRRKEPPLLPLGWLLLCGAVLILALHGTRWMIEPVVHRFAEALRLAVPGCR